MIIACPACTTRYAVPDSAIGVEGRTVRCAKCRHSWFQDGPEIPFTPAPQEPPTQSAATPAPTAPTTAAVAPDAPPPISRPAQPAPAADADQRADRSPGAESAVQRERPIMPPGREPEPAPLPDPVPRLDPLPPPAAPRKSAEKRPTNVYYDDTAVAAYADERVSSFDFSPPFRRRRNWAKIGTYAAAVFAVVTLGIAGAVAWGGLPDWVPIPRATFQQAQPDLQLDFPRKRQDLKPLPDGTEFFSVSGTISNIGSTARPVPSLLVVLRDERERIVYEKEIVPPKRKLAPGETITVNEALTDIPKAAHAAEIGWKPD